MMHSEESDHGWELAEPYYIDDGQLDGISPERAFVMGAEFIQTRMLALKGDPFETYVVSANIDRIGAMLAAHHFAYEYTQDDDIGWVHIRAIPR